MDLYPDLTQRVVIDTDAMPWHPTGTPGIHWRVLERTGADYGGRVTRMVRLDPGARVPAHTHAQGEEVYVLQGALQDAQGSYAAGTYVRNPPGSGHAPYSEGGCVFLIKAGQGIPGESERVVRQRDGAAWKKFGEGVQLSRLGLFRDKATGVNVSLIEFHPGSKVEGDLHTGGEELLVLEGTLEDEFGSYPSGTWLRQPDGSRHSPFSTHGCTIWLKRGHLAQPKA